MVAIVEFEDRAPSAQTAVDVFRGRWACDLEPLLGVSGTGPNLIFTHDKRPEQAARSIGRSDFSGMHILEIGPLEAAHTWLLEQMKAESVTCVEASVEAWLKCLIVKELLDLRRSTFLLGDAVRYLEEMQRRYDMIFCSGVLYHMEDPIRLIQAIASSAERCFVWTHVYDAGRHPVPFAPTPVERPGLRVNYWNHSYGPKTVEHWGGISPSAAWMTRDDLLSVFRAYGLSTILALEDQSDHPNGPAVAFTASRA